MDVIAPCTFRLWVILFLGILAILMAGILSLAWIDYQERTQTPAERLREQFESLQKEN